MAGITRGKTKHDALGPQLPNLVLTLEPEAMATSTALHALRKSHRQPMRRRHGVHADPSQGVLAAFELLRLDGMASPTNIRRRGLDQSDIVRRAMLVTVTQGAVHTPRAVPAQFPIRDDVRCHGAVTLDAVRRVSREVVPAATRCQRQNDQQQAATCPTQSSCPHLVAMRPKSLLEGTFLENIISTHSRRSFDKLQAHRPVQGLIVLPAQSRPRSAPWERGHPARITAARPQSPSPKGLRADIPGARTKEKSCPHHRGAAFIERSRVTQSAPGRVTPPA